MGVFTCATYAFLVSFFLLLILKILMNGLRVTENEEITGLDLSEHGSYGYPELVKVETKLKAQ
jgi:Amt family ammonium transporter